MQLPKRPSLLNLSSFRGEQNREAIRYHAYEYWSHFQDSLAAIYVGGSFHRNEAIYGVSDLDLYPFIVDILNDEDENWFKQTKRRIESIYPITNGFCRPRPVNDVLGGFQSTTDDTARVRSQTWVYRIRYDTTLIFGRDLIAGIHLPDMNMSQASAYFQSAWDLVRYAAGLESENKTDFHLPKTPARRLRKLARLAIIGGAYLLIGCGESYSFKGLEVLPALKARLPAWRSFFDETEGLYINVDSSATAEKISTYLSRLVLWMDWVGLQLSDAEHEDSGESGEGAMETQN